MAKPRNQTLQGPKRHRAAKTDSLPTVTIEPSFNVAYGGYIVSGFVGLLGRQNVHFGRLGYLSTADHHPWVLRAQICYGGLTRTVVIDLRDTSDVSGQLLQLVDVYGKTNLHQAESNDRCFAIGPTFGVASSHRAQILALLRAGATTADRLSQRATLSAYRPRPGRDNYLFFVAWPWTKHADVNTDRAALIRSMRDLREITFEGGFVPLGRLHRRRPAPGLEQLTAQKQYRHAAYLRRMRKSAFAVNTPAVQHCLGWKLGEFLALGKAVISLPLTRVMPGRFEHGEHIHLIKSTTEAESAMRALLDDTVYRRHLEHGARRYWEDYLEPCALVRRLIVRTFEGETLPAPISS